MRRPAVLLARERFFFAASGLAVLTGAMVAYLIG